MSTKRIFVASFTKRDISDSKDPRRFILNDPIPPRVHVIVIAEDVPDAVRKAEAHKPSDADLLIKIEDHAFLNFAEGGRLSQVVQVPVIE